MKKELKYIFLFVSYVNIAKNTQSSQILILVNDIIRKLLISEFQPLLSSVIVVQIFILVAHISEKRQQGTSYQIQFMAERAPGKVG